MAKGSCDDTDETKEHALSNPPGSILVTSERTNEIQGGYRNATTCPTPDSFPLSNVGQIGNDTSELVASNSQNRNSDTVFIREADTGEPEAISARDKTDTPYYRLPAEPSSAPKASNDRSIIHYKHSPEAKGTSLSDIVGLSLTAESYKRKLAQCQHKERLMACKFKSKNGFHSGLEKPRWQDEEEELIKKLCNLRMCLIEVDDGRHLGTGLHFGQGFLLTCYHVIQYLCKGSIIRKGNVIARFLDCTVSPSSRIFQVCSELTSVNGYYDIAILRMNKVENKTYPPSFDISDCSDGIKQEMTVYNVGYQIDDIEPNPVLVVDKAVVLETPPCQLIQKLNKYMEDDFSDKIAYNGLLRPGNIILWSSIIDGGSGGLIVRISTNTRSVELIGMYQNGYPKYFYDKDTSFTMKENFDPKLKVESGISFAKISSLLPDKLFL